MERKEEEEEKKNRVEKKESLRRGSGERVEKKKNDATLWYERMEITAAIFNGASSRRGEGK